MRELIGFVGKVILGAVTIAAVLMLFSPIGHFVCGPSRCMEGELYGQGHWALSGAVGLFASLLTLAVLLMLWAIGDFTKNRAEDVKFEINTWYLKRQIAARKLDSLEDNGDDPRDIYKGL